MQTQGAYVPQSKSTIVRTRLVTQLGEGLNKKLTLVSAPPGYGKTTAVSQLANSAPYPIVWHTVEERERDFPNLYQHCLAAFKTLSHDIESSLPDANDVPPSELAALIGDHIHSAGIGKCIYILDDIHHLDGSTACEEWLRVLLARVPQTCHVVLISRTLPKLSFADMIARNEIIAIGLNDLRMTGEEVQELADRMFGTPISDSQSKLLASLDGWPAGIALALQPQPDSIIEVIFGGSSGPEGLFDALAQPMLYKQSPNLRHFLLGSSTLSFLTPELCENVLDLPNSLEWLNTAQERNLFLTNTAGRLEYHQLFRSFLQNELKKTDPERFTNLHRQAGEWFEKVDDSERAFDHYMAANEAKQAKKIAENATSAFYGQGKFETMLIWSKQLDRAIILAPNLSYACSMIYTDRYDYDNAITELISARRGFNNTGDTRGVFSAKVQRAMIYLQQGQYHKALRIANPIASTPDTLLRGRALRVIGMAYFYLGHVATSIEHLENAVAIYRDHGLVSSLSHLLQDLQVAYTRLGNLDKVGSCLQEVVALRRKLRGKAGLALALASLGYYYHKCSNYTEALATFEEALQLVAGSPDRRTEGFLQASLGDLYRDLGAYARAQLAYDKTLQIVTPELDPTLYCATLISSSNLRRWEGKPHEAIMLAEESLKVADAYHKAFEASMSTAVLWLARAEIDGPGQALPHLQGAIDALQNQMAELESLEVLGGCAYVAACSGDKGADHEFTSMARQIARKLGNAQALAAEAFRNPQFEVVVPRLFQAPEIQDDLRKLHSAQSKLGSKVESVSPTVSETLSVRVLTFGQEKVERNGKVIPTADWKAAAPRELFFYLLFEGSKRRSEIEVVFWPDSGSERARGLFHTSLHSARQALGHDVIGYEDELYFINPSLNLECDAHQFESWTTQARLLPPHDARTEDLWRKAIAVYEGEFLQSLDAFWVIARRELYTATYVDALIGLGDCARARHDFKGAVEWYSASLTVDPYLENVYRHMITCYGAMGDLGKLKSCFGSLKKILKNDLDMAPSHETTALVQRFIGSS